MSSGRPVIGIACNQRVMDGFPLYATARHYVTSIVDPTGCIPLLLPCTEDVSIVGEVIGSLDGVVLTGGATNIQPHLYGEEPEPESGERDPGRDATAMALTHACLEQGVPLLGVCRGIQEMNVALGGSLWQHLRHAPGKFDHRRWRWRDQPMAVQLAPRHGISLRPGGMLQDILDGAREVKVNSLHGQGIKALADNLQVEATAADGTIEAVSVKEAKAFALGVQWHVEFAPADFPVHDAIFRAFGDACRVRHETRTA
jgi:putative glutamine amidotransferase